MKLKDSQLIIIKDRLTDYLESICDPSLPRMLSKDIAYLKPSFFDLPEKDVRPVQVVLRKIIEEIILRRVANNDEPAS